MRDDDDIIESYEKEFVGLPPRRRHGFLLVMVALCLAGVLLVVEIFANRPIATSIGHAEHSLREALAAAEVVESQSGTFSEADAQGLATADPTLTYRAPEEASTGLDDVSVYASVDTWAAAVQVTPGACFYLKRAVGRDDLLYGSGTICTGNAALAASDDRW